MSTTLLILLLAVLALLVLALVQRAEFRSVFRRRPPPGA